MKVQTYKKGDPTDNQETENKEMLSKLTETNPV